MALSTIEIPGSDPLYFTGSLGPPQISGQCLSKLLEPTTRHGLDDFTSGDTTESIQSGVVSPDDASLKRAHAVMDHESLGQAQTVTSTTVGPQSDLGLAKEDTAGAASESGSDEEEEGTSVPHKKISDRRRAQNAKFKSWLSNRAETITKEDIKAAVKGSDDDALSTRNLISKQESRVIITDPREYQMELFEKAKEENIIAVLDTGSGKTLIAVLLLRHVLDQELEDRVVGKKKRIAFFLVDCVTLVFQQFAVLENNLDQKIERFCGDMGCDLWHRGVWEKHFAENMVIVCTAEILYQCLMHAFITIEQINLLIFDEAHHAKKNHSYAKIIKDFYLDEPDLSKRPKVFGMTASPVDARVDVVKAAKELETLLHCRIATTADLTLLQRTVSRPAEIIAQYDRLRPVSETDLCATLRASYGDLDILSRLFLFATEATSQLGIWCADQIWSLGLAEEKEARNAERRVERTFLAEKETRPLSTLDADLARLRAARSVVCQHQFRPPTATPDCLSSKVLLLSNYLNLVFEKPTEAKCIVFVKRRLTARLLGDLFTRVGTAHLRVGILIGTNAGEVGDINVSFRQQVVTLMKFRKGELNCLFATSIAEEGLDIPDCNLVIRFDLYGTLIQYIQSRGRARHANSKYVHMVEKGNSTHLQALIDVRSAEVVMRRFCESLPADRLLQGNDCDLESAMVKQRLWRSYTEPETGAKLTYGSSMAVLAHFVGCLVCMLRKLMFELVLIVIQPHDNETALQVSYIMTVEQKQFVCEVILPENSPLRSATGRPSGRKSIAKRSAAFEACILLRKGKHLDSNFLPTYQKQLPAMRNALLALNLKKTNAYDMRLKPSVWESNWGYVPERLYLTTIALATSEGLRRPYTPLAMLTRTILPSIPPVLLHLDAGLTSDVVCLSLATSIEVDSSSLAKLTSFTLRIFQDVFAKEYEMDESKMSYWLAPLLVDCPISVEDRYPSKLVDWELLNFVQAHDQLEWTIDTPDSFLADKFLVDRFDGGKRYFSVNVAPELKALDPVPSDAAPHRHMSNILDYTVSLYSKSRARATWRDDQPVILAEKVLLRRNWLDEITEKEKVMQSKCYVCPEPLRISALPTGIAAMSLVIPAIVYRLESYLVALEACQTLRLDVKPDLALEALTKDSDNTEEHRNEQIHFQRGMGRNYERLEFMGDCFLKMATSIALFTQNPDNDEFEYHVKRMLLICNKNLFNTALKLKLYEYIRSQSFSRRTWYPEGLKLLKGKGHTKTGKEVFKHLLGDKTIADVCEALIGAALLSQKESGTMDMAVKAVTMLVSNPDHEMQTWNDYYKLYEKPTYQIAPASASQLDLAAQIELKHPYHFQHPRLLRSAFIHPSYPFSWEKVPCYQRLEFLGDSLLDMACINFLFFRYPDRDPQWLTEHKMAMVSNKFLGAVCVKLGFHKHLRYNGALVEYQIREYVTELAEAERDSDGARDYWTMVKNPPKCLPDVVEAYIGAVFVDAEFDYKEVERFFDTHIRWFFEDMSIYDTFANNHPTTYLHNLLTLTFTCTNYRVMANPLPSLDGAPVRVLAGVLIHDDIVAEGTASSGRYAKLKASTNALELLKGLAPFEFRARFGCNCSVGQGKEVGLEEVGSAI